MHINGEKKGKRHMLLPVVVTWWSDINFNTKWNMLLNKEHNKCYAPCIFIFIMLKKQ